MIRKVENVSREYELGRIGDASNSIEGDLLRATKAALQRKNWKANPKSALCNKHFITGKPSSDAEHPDYVPSIIASMKNKGSSSSVNRYNRQVKRREVWNAPLTEIENEPPILKLDTKEVDCQTDLTFQEISKVSFVSKLYGGRTSDKQIQLSGFLEQIRPGDVIFADRGFPVKDLVAERGASLVLPASTKEICIAKFQNLRTYYRNEKKKQSSFRSGTDARDLVPEWEHFARLQFLDDTIKPLHSISNLDYMELGAGN
ncbi:hypothetical protein TNCV_2242361 [Trichonephila clavipes]|nr:hypothetical protein TNCV_2242361 [Trichonephila clavipes]